MRKAWHTVDNLAQHKGYDMFHKVNGKLVYLPVVNPASNHIAEAVAPRNPYATGYGKAIPTRHKVRVFGNRFVRVYAACYSNTASLYIKHKGKCYLLDTTTFGQN